MGKTWNFWCYESKSYNFIWELRGNNLGITWENVGGKKGISRGGEMGK